VDPPGPEGTRLLLDLEAVGEGRGRRAARGGIDLRLGAGETPPLKPGDRIAVPALLDRIAGLRNPGADETAARWARRGVFLRGRTPDPAAVQRCEAAPGAIPMAAGWRRSAAAAFDERLDPIDAGLARSIVLGDRGSLSPADRDRFWRTGQAHVVAVSGFHVALVGGGVVWISRLLFAGRRLAAVLGILAILVYLPLAGGAPSAVRAGVGGILYLVAPWTGRPTQPLGILALVALALLVAEPGIGFDAGFRLSCAAVLGILLFGRRVEELLVPWTPRIPSIVEPPKARVRRLAAASAGAWLATAPVLLDLVGQVCPGGILTSIVTAPLGGALIATGVAAGLLAGVPGLGDAAAFSFHVTAEATRAVLDLALATGLRTVAATAPHWGWHLAYAAAFLLATLGPSRGFLLSSAAMAGLLLGAVRGEPTPPPEDPRLVLLEVGHGQAAILLLPDGRTAVLDAGSRHDPEVGRRVVAPALRALGARSIDLLVLSHADSDHCGGAPALAAEFDCRRLVVPPGFAEGLAREDEDGMEVEVAAAGDRLLEGDWGRLVVLSPSRDADPGWSENEASLVLAVETPGGTRVLLAADVGEAAARDMESRGVLRPCSVLVLPHHGLPATGRDLLVSGTRAPILLASCDRTTLPRLPPDTWATAASGALELVLAPDGARVSAPWSRRAPLPGYAPSPMPIGAIHTEGPGPWIAAAGLLAFAWAASRALRWLTPLGAALAWTLGFATFLAFGVPGLAALFAPFLVANLLGRLPGAERAPARTAKQVVSNGLPPFLGAVFALVGLEEAGAWAFLGGLACLGADSCATEVGVRYGGVPRSILTGARLAPGESGGVTGPGLATSVVGALLAPAAWVVGGGGASGLLWIPAAAGVAGALLDSVLGASLQYRGTDPASGERTEARVRDGHPTTRLSGISWLDNDAVNLVAGLAAALLAAGIGGLSGR
jgi:competence protein ComEC